MDPHPSPPFGPVTLCGSLSLHPVALGANMHNAGYRALGLPFVYHPFRVDDDLEGAVGAMRALNIRGFGVSMPYKLRVIPLCNKIDPIAERIGAINTIVNDDGILTGHNTDWVGAVRALQEVRPISDARCLVLGAGGAARAVVFGLVDAGARVTIANRDPQKAQALAAESACDWSDIREVDQSSCKTFDVVVNATSVGMNASSGSAPSPLDVNMLHDATLVMDIVYKPLMTPLLRASVARGLAIVDGSRMLLHQAARQFELYTGITAPLRAMDDALIL